MPCTRRALCACLSFWPSVNPSPPDAASYCDKRAQLTVVMLSCQLLGDAGFWDEALGGVCNCPALELADVKGSSSDQLSASSILMSGQGRETNGLDDLGCQTSLTPKKPLHHLLVTQQRFPVGKQLIQGTTYPEQGRYEAYPKQEPACSFF